jgi:hypothetical protein
LGLDAAEPHTNTTIIGIFTGWFISIVGPTVTFAMRTAVTRMKVAVTRGVASTTTRRWFQPSTLSPEMA